MEILKELHIPFRYKIKIKGREIDFLIGNIAIEIDSHLQDSSKNWMLINEGYRPIHFHSWEVTSNQIREWLKRIWQVQVYQPRIQQ